MDVLTKTWAQFTGLIGKLSPSQRLSLLVAPVLVLGAFGYLLLNSGSSKTMTPLVGGKPLTTGEIDTAVSVLHERGLTDYERAGNQLLVPAAEVTEYHGALLAGGGLPNGWGEMFEKELTGSSVFTSNERLQTMREIALAKFIREWLRTVPEVMDGNVVWARSRKRTRFTKDGPPSVTATVTLRPKPGREITAPLAESIRRMIANAIPDLTPDQVVVFSSSGRAFTPDDDDDPMGSRLLSRIREFTDEYRARVESALSYIPEVLVTVHVDVDNVARSIEKGVDLDPKSSLEISRRSEDASRSIATTEPNAEPGARSNTPRSLQSNNGPRRDERDQKTVEEVEQRASFLEYQRELVAAMPTGVRVAIGIPEDYYESAVVNKGVERGEDEASRQSFDKAVEEFRTTVGDNVTATVANALGTPSESISVTSYVRVDPVAPPISIPLTQRVGDWFGRWGGTLGLGLFAVFALWSMRRGTADSPEAGETEEEAESDAPDAPPELPEPLEELPPDPEQEAREELQATVRENPEMAAAVISKWIKNSK